jgi:putative oxidoreductase
MNFLDPYAPMLRSVLRIIAGLVFLHYGLAKLIHFPPMPMFAAVTPTAWPEGIASLIESIGGVLIVVGLFSRIAAFICSGEMAFGYFMLHAPQSPYPAINGGAAAILFCFVFLYLAAAGPGPWALNQK